jgi:hypothetical protein
MPSAGAADSANVQVGKGMTGLDEHQVRPDALHTQRDHADFLVTGKNAHYMFRSPLKGPFCACGLTIST